MYFVSGAASSEAFLWVLDAVPVAPARCPVARGGGCLTGGACDVLGVCGVLGHRLASDLPVPSAPHGLGGGARRCHVLLGVGDCWLLAVLCGSIAVHIYCISDVVLMGKQTGAGVLLVLAY
jgi:hypothetical protein